jgi:D-threonate/D-erythronate kinase
MAERYRPAAMRQNADVELLVAADDRTGAFETAAALADRGVGPVPVTAWPEPVASGPVAVIDLACRHLSPAEAAERAGQLPVARFQAHKTDSTLRGNWADELVARATTTPVLLVPALPKQGRTCVNGVVLDHGRPVHEGAAGTDVRRRVLTARPAEAIRAAGGAAVELAGDAAVQDWLQSPTAIAVVDADDDLVIDKIVERWAEVADRAGSTVVLAGTSVVVAGAARVVATGRPPEPLPPLDGPVLVVCGSVHPASRRQLEYAEHRGLPVTYLADEITARTLMREGAVVLASEIPVGDVTEPMAVAAAASLARGVDDLLRSVDVGALVVVGGDTAAAVLGSAGVSVHGSVDAGTAWARVDGFAMPVITRSGGFGSDSALIDLLGGLR